MIRAALLALVSACAASAAPAPDPAPAPSVPRDAGADARLGKHGEICRAGGPPTGHDVLQCGPGLQCCYPCGIQGCAWVCHTASECSLDRQRP